MFAAIVIVSVEGVGRSELGICVCVCVTDTSTLISHPIQYNHNIIDAYFLRDANSVLLCNNNNTVRGSVERCASPEARIMHPIRGKMALW